jgi:glycosyltransferase involved in cell wall biosynthesis
MALFDVLMPVKNGEAFIERAIASVQAQTERDWRLLVLDHGSTDGTAAIVDRLARQDRRIERQVHAQAEGLAGLLNEGLQRLQAPFAMRMDADDECVPQRMAWTRDTFHRHPDVAAVGGQAEAIDAEGRRVGRLDNPCDRDALTRRAMFRSVFVHPAMSLRTSAVVDRGLRYGVSTFRGQDAASAALQVPNLAEDYLLFGELALDGQLLNMPQTVLRYRMHPGGVSRQKYTAQLSVTALVSRHLAGVVSRRTGLPAFDPAPFCSHAQTLFDVGDSTDYRDEYDRMHQVLSRAGGAWSRGEGELRWRRVFVDRSAAGIAGRAALRLADLPDRWEAMMAVHAVRRILRHKDRFALEAAHAASST